MDKQVTSCSETTKPEVQAKQFETPKIKVALGISRRVTVPA
jgi:hypothetical protein